MAFLNYDGPLKNPNDMPPGPVKDAYISWREQRTRCYNPNRDKYKHYGARGIEVRYSSREFIGWWLNEIKLFKGDQPTISRIDHSGHYEFGNIKIESRSENSSERNRRAPTSVPPKPVIAIDRAGNELGRFKSISEASRITGVSVQAVSQSAKNMSDGRWSGIFFRYTA